MVVSTGKLCVALQLYVVISSVILREEIDIDIDFITTPLYGAILS